MIWVAFQYPIISSYLHRNGCLINAWWCFFITISFFLGISEYQQSIWYGPYIIRPIYTIEAHGFFGHSRHSPVFRKPRFLVHPWPRPPSDLGARTCWFDPLHDLRPGLSPARPISRPPGADGLDAAWHIWTNWKADDLEQHFIQWGKNKKRPHK